jgi:hypothetical protein
MARKSFTLQKVTPAYGSYLTYPSGSAAASAGLAVREDDDTRLKSDGVLLPPTLNTPVNAGSLLNYVSYFEVTCNDYTETHLRWDAPLNDLANASSNSEVLATSIVISYSTEGEPPTIGDGIIIVDSNYLTEYFHTVPSGKWAYYTLFVRFEARDGTVYYEPAAQLSILTPKELNSVDELFANIPEHYRELDGTINDDGIGPLYKFLQIFGFEMDRMRTSIEYAHYFKDPQVSDSQVLDYLAQDLGIPLRVHELGAVRLRGLLNIIGFVRRAGGTPSAIEYALQAITGSDIEVDTATNTIKVYAQRVNLLKDPSLSVIMAGLFDGGNPNTSTFSLSLEAGAPNTASFTSTYEGGTPSATGGTATGGELWSFDPVVSGSGYVLQTLSNYIPVIANDDLYFSLHAGAGSTAQDTISKVALYATAPYGSVSPSPVLVAESTTPTTISGIKYWTLSVPDTYTTYTNVYLAIFTSSGDASATFRKMLLERAIGGLYFDGNTTLGGWLVDGNTVSDYRWYNPSDSDGVSGTPVSNFSIYNSNYQKTRVVVNRLLTYLLPVTELTTGSSTIYSNGSVTSPKWSVKFNYIPGVTYV